uniref:Probable 26S proteasome regulatory subunit p27 n=1 Tax=Blastobotrys adeninivorans TaxID=409370 RepID=A0A060TAA8_BLAAD
MNGDAPGNSERLKGLINQRSRMESELDDLVEVLASHNADMDTPLVTADGFPRSDIDVSTVRSTRAQIIRLRNDLKSVMAEIESGLHSYFSGQSMPAAGRPGAPSESEPDDANLIPFAHVNSVTPDSPAHRAGLTEGDRILKFGHANAANHNRLSLLGSIVRDNDGKEIPLILQRDEQQVRVTLIPDSSWPGRGALGCHILPL